MCRVEVEAWWKREPHWSSTVLFSSLLGGYMTNGTEPSSLVFFCSLISCLPCEQRLFCICNASLGVGTNFTNLLTQEAFSLTVRLYCHILVSHRDVGWAGTTPYAYMLYLMIIISYLLLVCYIKACSANYMTFVLLIFKMHLASFANMFISVYVSPVYCRR